MANDKGNLVSQFQEKILYWLSAVVHEATELVIGAQSDYQADLKETGNLSEVVVTVERFEEKKRLFMLLKKIDNKELNQNLQPNVINAMQGKFTGVTVSVWVLGQGGHQNQRY